MPGPCIRHVLYFYACTDVVGDHGPAVRTGWRNHDADVRKTARQAPADDIAWQKCVRGSVLRQSGPVPLEKGLQIENPAVINVAVGPAQAPATRISGKGGAHVLVHQLLQVYASGAEGPHHDIRADAAIRRNIAIGIGECDIARIVNNGAERLGLRRAGDDAAKVKGGGETCGERWRRGRHHKESETE